MNLEMERIALLADRLHLPQLTANLPLLAEEAARKEQSYWTCPKMADSPDEKIVFSRRRFTCG